MKKQDLIVIWLIAGIVLSACGPGVTATPKVAPTQPGNAPPVAPTATLAVIQASPVIMPTATASASPTPEAPSGFLPMELAKIEPGTVGSLRQMAEIRVSEVLFLSFSPQGRELAALSQRSADRSWFAGFWDLTGGKELLALENWERTPEVLFFPGGAFLAAMIPYHPFVLWDAIIQEKIGLLGDSVYYAAFSPDWSFLVSNPAYDSIAGKSGVDVVDTASGQTLQSIEIDGMLMGVAFSPDGQRFALNAGGGVQSLPTTVWDSTTGALLATLQDADKLSFSPDGQLAAALHPSEKWLRVFDSESWQEKYRLGEKGNAVLDRPVFTPDGHLLAALSITGITMWDVGSGEEVGSVLGQFSNFAFSPDGYLLATCEYAGTLKVWGITP